MCRTCGCPEEPPRLTSLEAAAAEVGSAARHQHVHDEGLAETAHRHGHDGEPTGRTLVLQQAILAKNDELAARNRAWLQSRQVLALNLLSSPGSGKTTILERTLTDVRDELVIQVIEGDQETARDAERLRSTGCRVVQLNTGAGCHLDSAMVGHALEHLAPAPQSIVMIENVGNLVCPALFDLGEAAKVVILSVTEGEDKPLKYPHMFRAARLMLLNKIDLLPHVRFDVDRCVQYARTINPELEVVRLSAVTGEGMPHWYAWLRRLLAGRPMGERAGGPPIGGAVR